MSRRSDSLVHRRSVQLEPVERLHTNVSKRAISEEAYGV